MTGRDVEGIETVEVVHEALIRGWSKLRGWMESDRAFRVWQERLRAGMRQWEASERDEGALLRGVPLSTAEGWLVERPENLSVAESDFIRASVAQRQALEAEAVRQRSERERLRRRLTGVLTAGLALAVVLAAVAGLQWQSASRQRDAAQLAISRQLGAQAQNLVQERFDLALLLGVEAARMVASPESEQALVTVMAANPSLEQFRWEEREASDLAVSVGGRFVALFADDGIVILDRGGRQPGAGSTTPRVARGPAGQPRSYPRPRRACPKRRRRPARSGRRGGRAAAGPGPGRGDTLA